MDAPLLREGWSAFDVSGPFKASAREAALGGIYSIVKDRPVEPFAGFAGVGFGSSFPVLEMFVLSEIAGFVSAIYFARVLDFGLGLVTK